MSGLNAAFGLLVFVAVLAGLSARTYRQAAALRRQRANILRVLALADGVHERLGWSHAPDPEFDTTRVFISEVDGVAVRLAVGCTELGDWANIALHGSQWLPDTFQVSLPRSGGRDPAGAEPPNFMTDDGTGLMVLPLAIFADPAAPFHALARALGAAACPKIGPAEFSDRTAVTTAGDVAAFVRASLAHAARWADATAAWQRR